MQITAAFISVFIGIAVAQDVTGLVSQIPSCGLTCLLTGATAAGCDATDYTCQCQHMDVIEANVTSCLQSSCSASDLGTVMSISTQICAEVEGTSSNSTSSTGSNSTSSTGTSTGSSTGSSASSTSSSTGTSAASRTVFTGLGWVTVAGLVGAMVM